MSVKQILIELQIHVQFKKKRESLQEWTTRNVTPVSMFIIDLY